MLDPYRVLDLTDERGQLGGMILGDLGADVIRVELPDGSAARRSEPRLHDPETGKPGPSLAFLAYNRNKRSIVLDPDNAADNRVFLELVAGADFVLASSPDGDLEARGLDFEQLRAANPTIVVTLVTPYGSDGPLADLPASDLTIAAMGGPVALQGSPDRAPVRVSVPQVWRHAGAEAAVATLVAHHRRLRTGEAQLVDLSAQSVMTWTMLNAMDAAAIQGFDFVRKGSKLPTALEIQPLIACADGYVIATPGSRTAQVLVPWMIEDGTVGPDWANEDWATFDHRIIQGEPTDHTFPELAEAVGSHFAKYGKWELFDRAVRDGTTIAPSNTVADLAGFDHLRAREVWRDASLPDGRSVSVPGPFITHRQSPVEMRYPAPDLDEHGAAIRSTLGSRIPTVWPTPDGAEFPLDGLKVLDLTWIGVGPISARALADHGATVVRVESAGRPDGLRFQPPSTGPVDDPNRSQFFGDFNTSKQSLMLDLKNPEAIGIARRLIAWADVYIESFTPGTVDGLGLGYAAAVELNPEIVMISTSLMGQTGPARSVAGFGYHAGAMAGFYEVTGWPDRPPDGPWLAYTDTIAPRFVIPTILAALDERRRTGKGCHVDAAQLEMALHLLAPEIAEYQLTGVTASRLGNRSRHAAPHGVYPCAGDDRWCAIAVDTDTQWQGLRDALGDPEWARDPQLATVSGRLAVHDLIDEHLARWTAPQDSSQLIETLRSHGVPVGAAQRSSDLLADPQYGHRTFYRWFDHPEMGHIPYAGHQYRIHGYDHGPRWRAPCLGEHTFEVCTELLGMTDEEVGNAAAGGAFA